MFNNSINFDVKIISAVSPNGIALHVAWTSKWLAVTKKLKLFLILSLLNTLSIATLIPGKISFDTFTEVDNKLFMFWFLLVPTF